jgi:hypothetical protein
MSQPPPRPNKLTGPPPRPPKKFQLHIQRDLIEPATEDGQAPGYTSKILAPIYKPSGKKPDILELLNQSKAKALIGKILASKVSEAEKKFLVEAAKRHNVFYYKLIANYYAQSSPEMQALMEQSALVIIDFDKAIESGYIDFNEEVEELYKRETGH